MGVEGLIAGALGLGLVLRLVVDGIASVWSAFNDAGRSVL